VLSGNRDAKNGDSITVDLKEGILTFKLNGEPQGEPIDLRLQLPEDALIAMAVTITTGPGTGLRFA